ncbi:MAG TPA: ATP-binding cassette domain-containing protein [Mycobacteriales bacterium]|nr:ATP-binding cassette domain-containing protein [Mycobacteriales bacterium]
MSTAMVEVTELRKRYGATRALDGVTFGVEPGRITGFVGPNGAGKSTTMRVILGLDAVDSGTALVGGHRYETLAEPLRAVGALLDAGALQHNRSGRNHLLWLAHSHGLPAARVDEVIDLVGLGPAARRKAGGYSLGMRQRLGIAAAMLGDPPVLLMDEPFNGMDPEGIVWMRGFLRALAAQGRAVLISSHLMSELQDIADHLIVIGRGKVLADTSVEELVATVSGQWVTLRTSASSDASRVLTGAGGEVNPSGVDVLTVTGLAPQRIVALLGEAGVPLSEIAAHRASLEEAYLALTRDAGEFHAAATEGVAR